MKEEGLGSHQLILKCQTQGENNPLIEDSGDCGILSQGWTTISVKISSFIYLTRYCYVEWGERGRNNNT